MRVTKHHLGIGFEVWNNQQSLVLVCRQYESQRHDWRRRQRVRRDCRGAFVDRGNFQFECTARMGMRAGRSSRDIWPRSATPTC